MDCSSIEIENFLEKQLQMTDPELREKMMEQITPCTAPKGTVLLQTGERPENLYLLWSGIARGFLLDENGEDTTDCFCIHRGNVLWGCVPIDEPSVVNVETLSDCELLRVNVSGLLELMAAPDIVRMANQCLSQALELHWNMRMMLCQNDTMKRYRWFLKEYPGLAEQVSKRHIASFLGMNPVTLSRIRKRLREEA